ncbi:hypothetical protein IWQ57_004599 [Coemansia nantahalensis]|uniref:Uncharacterized protein n=1 Tax=Coemansia nantahalensis TaxID=2789366 RepID=A0ACC1JRG7_9FUNG|nr:hypothetical protein IWQ57_004599 [Coemansia nantahalensis]
MSSDLSFFDATLAQLAQLSAQRAFSADTRVPEGARYPPKHYDFQLPIASRPLVPAEEREDFYSLTFKTLKAPVRKFTLHVSSVRTVAQVKRHLGRIANIPVGSMRLVLGGKGLVDGKLIGDYSIPADAVIQIISKPAGAAADAGDAPADVPDVNPLSAALGADERRPVVPAVERAIEETAAAAAAAGGDMTDASSDAEGATALDRATRDQLQHKTGAFRNNLRQLLHTQFGGSQADAVDGMLDSYFASL